jgi:hypothetical protein
LKDVETLLINFDMKNYYNRFQIDYLSFRESAKMFALNTDETAKNLSILVFQINIELAQKINFKHKFENIYFSAIKL